MRSDLRLIKEYLHGSAGAFDALFERHGRSVEAFAFHLAGSRADAEDLSQSTWMQALESLSSYRGRGSFRAWLHGIALNLYNDQGRRSRVATVSLDEEQAGPAVGDDPHRALEQSMAMSALRAALDSLGSANREVLILAKIQGLKHQEIATILNCPVGTVSSRLHYAVAALRAALASDSALEEVLHEMPGRSGTHQRSS
jgi:RNA polymerase sigma-70 factor (ECF subfamily)